MLALGECEAHTATEAARLFGLSRQRYYQLLDAYSAEGTWGLIPDTPGPKTNYRRTDEVVRLVIRNRFLDPDAPPRGQTCFLFDVQKPSPGSTRNVGTWRSSSISTRRWVGTALAPSI